MTKSSPVSILKAISGSSSFSNTYCIETISCIKSSPFQVLPPIFWSSNTIEGSHIAHEYCSDNCFANRYSHSPLTKEVKRFKEGSFSTVENRLFLKTNERNKRKIIKLKLPLSPRFLQEKLISAGKPRSRIW